MKTTKKHYEFFVKECEYWLDRFNLNSWRVDFGHRVKTDIGEGVLAWCTANWMARACAIGLQLEVSSSVSLEERTLSKVAFHEVCELLLHLLRIIAETDAKPTTLDEIDGYTHAIIRRMEKAIWEPYWAGGIDAKKK